MIWPRKAWRHASSLKPLAQMPAGNTPGPGRRESRRVHSDREIAAEADPVSVDRVHWHPPRAPRSAWLAKTRRAWDIKGLSFDLGAADGQQERNIHARCATHAFATGQASAPDGRSPGPAHRNCRPMWTPGRRLPFL